MEEVEAGRSPSNGARSDGCISFRSTSEKQSSEASKSLESSSSRLVEGQSDHRVRFSDIDEEYTAVAIDCAASAPQPSSSLAEKVSACGYSCVGVMHEYMCTCSCVGVVHEYVCTCSCVWVLCMSKYVSVAVCGCCA